MFLGPRKEVRSHAIIEQGGDEKRESGTYGPRAESLGVGELARLYSLSLFAMLRKSDLSGHVRTRLTRL